MILPSLYKRKRKIRGIACREGKERRIIHSCLAIGRVGDRPTPSRCSFILTTTVLPVVAIFKSVNTLAHRLDFGVSSIFLIDLITLEFL